MVVEGEGGAGNNLIEIRTVPHCQAAINSCSSLRTRIIYWQETKNLLFLHKKDDGIFFPIYPNV